MSDNGFIRVSTRSLPARRRFDYWRSFHYLIDIDVPKGNERTGFSADLLHYAGEDATSFGHVSNDDTVTRFANSNEEFVLLSLTVSGSIELTTKDGASCVVTPASGLVVVDSTRHLETRSRGHEHVYLTLPRAAVPERTMTGIGATRDGVCFLPKGGITGILTSHMMQIAKENERLSPGGAAAAVKAARDLALASLELAHSPAGVMQSDRHDHALRIAAHRFIALHLADRGLTAERIAAALGCSRAHLYRVFARQGEPIGQVIRAARLERASDLIAANPGWPVERIAALCGFANASAFIRMFRRERGITPSALRDAGRG